MALVPAVCTQCGAAIEVDNSKEAGICKHCGTAFITEKAINNYVTNNVNNITNNVTKIIYGKEKDEGEDFYNRALTYIKVDDINSAKKELEQAIKVQPERALYRIHLFFLKTKNLEDHFAMDNLDTKQLYVDATKTIDEKDAKTIREQFGLDFTTKESAITSLFEKFLPEFESLVDKKLLPSFIIDEIKKIDNDNSYKQDILEKIKNKALETITDMSSKTYRFYEKNNLIMFLKDLLPQNDIEDCIKTLNTTYKYQTLYNNTISGNSLDIRHPEFLPDDLCIDNERINEISFNKDKVLNSFTLTPFIVSIKDLRAKIIKVKAGIPKDKLKDLLLPCMSEVTEMVEFDESYTDLKLKLEQESSKPSFNPNLFVYTKNPDAKIKIHVVISTFSTNLDNDYEKCDMFLGHVKDKEIINPGSITEELAARNYISLSERNYRQYKKNLEEGETFSLLYNPKNPPTERGILTMQDFLIPSITTFQKNIEKHLVPSVFKDLDEIRGGGVKPVKEKKGLFKRLFGK